MRWRRLGSIVVLMVVGSACGGAAEQDVLSASSSSSSSSGSSGTTSTGSPGASSSSTSSGGGSTSSSSGGGKDQGGGCTQEKEPNDAPSTANTLVSSMCGKLSPGSETDYLTFDLPQGTKTMNFGFDGDVELKVSVEGKDTVTLSPASNPPIPFVVGKPYLIEIRAFKGGDSIPWRVNLSRN